MKRYLVNLLLLISLLSFSQNSKFRIEASYPLPIDQNFIGKYYDGIADLGVKYQIRELNNFTLGVSLNTALLKADRNEYSIFLDGPISYKVTSYSFEPRFFMELKLKKITKLHTAFGIGYSFMFFNIKNTSPEENIPNSSSTQSGINTNLQIAYDISNRIYVQTQYDFILLTNLEDGIPKNKYNTNINLIKLGIGFRL
jgi:hypothetical protein